MLCDARTVPFTLKTLAAGSVNKQMHSCSGVSAVPNGNTMTDNPPHGASVIAALRGPSNTAAQKLKTHLQADLAAWVREVHALWLGRGLYSELRVADVVQEVRSARLSRHPEPLCSIHN
jgi:hypothetical protein